MDKEAELIALHLTLGSTASLRRELEYWAENVQTTTPLKESAAQYRIRRSYAIEQARSNWPKAEAILARFKEMGIEVIPSTDTRYPARLKEVGSFPPLLYAKGNLELLKASAIAICGSRHALPGGLNHAHAFGKLAAEMHICSISGYAKGVDTSAHLGALRSSGCTIIVLADGILNFRVKRDFLGIEQFWDRTLVLSQFPPEQPWRVYTAMERNRIICGLARGLAVVEAGETGGTLAAGRECLRQKKPLWVVEYSSPRDDCHGNTILLREGGIPIRTIKELRSALTSLHEDSAP